MCGCVPRKREGVPLEVRDLRAGEEDVLSGPRCRLLLLDLELHDVRRVLDDFGYVGPVAGAHFTEDTLEGEDHSASKPVALQSRGQPSPTLCSSRCNTYPEDTDGVPRAERLAVGLDHAEHAVQLPVQEEDDEQVVRVPELLEVRATALLDRVPHHDGEGGGHDPAGDAGARREVRDEPDDETFARRLGERVGKREARKVDHVRGDVDEGEETDAPGDGLVEGDVLVERNVRVERRAPEQRDEVPADGQQDERHLDVQDQRRGTRDSLGRDSARFWVR